MSIYLEDSKAPVEEEVTAFDLEVTGEIPKELEGRSVSYTHLTLPTILLV